VTFMRSARGTAALEFALAAPVLLALIFGVVELSRGLWSKAALQHGVQMAARCGAIAATGCTSDSLTQAYAASQSYGLAPPASTFTVSTAACGKLVVADYSFLYASGLLGRAGVTLSARSCFPT
jgi:Flp pilus assembly protein TadG